MLRFCPVGNALKRVADEARRRLIIETYATHKGNHSAVARALGVNRGSLYRIMVHLGIQHEREKGAGLASEGTGGAGEAPEADYSGGREEPCGGHSAGLSEGQEGCCPRGDSVD